MTSYKNENKPDYNLLIERIVSLETRLSKLESMLRIEWIEKEVRNSTEAIKEEENIVANTESKVVEYGLSWLGSIVLIFGIIFLMTYLDGLGYYILSHLIAYALTFTLVAFTLISRNTFPVLANVLIICNPLLLFYITLNLYFFTEHQVISQKGIELLFLILLIAIQFGLAIRKNSELLASIGILLCSVTVVFMDVAMVFFIILTAIALVSTFLFYWKRWWHLLIFSLFAVYLTHLIWLLNNPIIGNPSKFVESAEYNVLFLFGYGFIYTLPVFISKELLPEDGKLVSITIWNALLFAFLVFLEAMAFYREDYSLIYGAIAMYCILFSVFLKLKNKRRFAPATYACFGFLALSISVYGFAGLPNAYFLLVLQSFLVVSMALWFKSRIIVVVNSFLFVTILCLYLITSEYTNWINFAFAFTSLATARILNWKKDRLKLKTEIFRNTFLAITFVMVLFSLNRAFPSQYVTLAWTGAAIGFFLLSIMLKNIKYRYISVLTILVTGGHLFFVDLSHMEIGYRVIAFMVFAIISLGVSLYYTKRIHHHTP